MPDEFRSGYIPGAVNISLQELSQKMNKIPKDKPVVIYCRSGNRSAHAAQALLQAGYTEVLDLGGIFEWSRAASGGQLRRDGQRPSRPGRRSLVAAPSRYALPPRR